MLKLESGHRGSPFDSSSNAGWGHSALEGRSSSRGPSPALLITGVVVLGLGFLAWTYLGPDLKRYLKIHSM